MEGIILSSFSIAAFFSFERNSSHTSYTPIIVADCHHYLFIVPSISYLQGNRSLNIGSMKMNSSSFSSFRPALIFALSFGEKPVRLIHYYSTRHILWFEKHKRVSDNLSTVIYRCQVCRRKLLSVTVTFEKRKRIRFVCKRTFACCKKNTHI